MTESLTLFGQTLPVAVWTAGISVVGAIAAAFIGGTALLVAQYVGRQNLKLQIERDDRALKAQMERDDRVIASQTERDDRKRLQDARLKAYETFFEKADLWSSIMARGAPSSPVKYEETQRLINEMIAASAPARLVAPAETVQLMIGYLACASHVVLLSRSDPYSAQTQEARYQAEEAHVQLTDRARRDVGNADGSIARMYQSVR